jgi:hypothetical protein
VTKEINALSRTTTVCSDRSGCFVSMTSKRRSNVQLERRRTGWSAYAQVAPRSWERTTFGKFRMGPSDRVVKTSELTYFQSDPRHIPQLQFEPTQSTDGQGPPSRLALARWLTACTTLE